MKLERYLAFRVALATPDDDSPGGVLRREGRLDVADVQRIPVPDGISVTPAQWVHAVFDVRRAPIVVRALMGLRQLVVPLIGVPRTVYNPFRIREIREDEALLLTRERHLTFWCSVGEKDSILAVATAVRLHGWRGRVYWLPVSLLHRPVTRAMMRRAVRTLAAASDQG